MKDYISYVHGQEQADRAEVIRAIMGNPPETQPEPETVSPSVQTDTKQATDPAADRWPKPLSPEAFHGAAGEVVRLVLPHTEADEAGILIQLLLGFGNAISRSPYLSRGPEKHFTNLFAVLVGDTSIGRKGSAWSMASYILKAIDPSWADQRILSGLSSGEGLIHHVRDANETEEPIKDKKTNAVTGRQTVITDRGIEDKRLLVIESEFSAVLRKTQQDTNILSTVIRQSWESGNLRTLTKHSPDRATGAHVSLIGHITPTELSRYLVSTEITNGFANRFLWIMVKRSKALPHGGELQTVDMAPILRILGSALDFSRRAGEITMDQQASELWETVYEQLTQPRPGLAGSATCRAAPQVLRLAMIYALLDKSGLIRLLHLTAALEIWRYCEASARCVFGEALGDSTADSLLRALRNAPKGITRKGIIENVFKRNKKSDEIERALQLLRRVGLAHSPSNGTAETWFASPVN